MSDMADTPSTPSENTTSAPAPSLTPTINSTNLASVLNHISNNPEEAARIMEESIEKMDPDIMDKARRMAAGGQGQEILREMQRRGIDTNAMRAQILQQRKALQGLAPKKGDTKSVVLITSNRQLKIRTIPINLIQAAAENIIGSPKIVSLSCSRLAIGPLKGKTIKVWCNPEVKGRNRRLSKILGFPIGGDGLIVVEEGDLDEQSFLTAERELA